MNYSALAVGISSQRIVGSSWLRERSALELESYEPPSRGASCTVSPKGMGFTYMGSTTDEKNYRCVNGVLGDGRFPFLLAPKFSQTPTLFIKKIDK